MPEPTLEAWAQIRFAYEHTDQPLAHICAEHDITVPMLRYRMKRWDWTRRRAPVPDEGPPAVAGSYPPLEGEGEEAATIATLASLPLSQPEPSPHRSYPPPPGEGEEDAAAIVSRLQGAVARVLAAIEATAVRLAAAPAHPREMEQAGRALFSLTRTYRELNALLAGQMARAAEQDDEKLDIDEFRNELARRINSFIDDAERRQSMEAKAAET